VARVAARAASYMSDTKGDEPGDAAELALRRRRRLDPRPL